MDLRKQFKKVTRPTGDALLHINAPVWVVQYEYDSRGSKVDTWKAYRTVAHLPRGRDPWTVDNRSLNKDGYSTEEAALQAAHEFAQTFSQKVAA